MIRIYKEGCFFHAIGEGGELIKTRKLAEVSETLVENLPDEVEAHILTGNTIHFEIEHDDEQALKNLLNEDFREANDLFFEHDE